MILLLAALAQAEPLVIEVGPDVSEVFLDCGLREERYRVIGGKATITPPPPADCDVMLSKKVGSVRGGGAWACTDTGCTESTGGAPSGAPVKAGHVGILLEGGAHAMSLEIDCEGGYRRRVNVVEQRASFDDVPDDSCTLLFKGGVPAKFRPITFGDWGCSFQGSVAVCKRR